jgi:hypothetical protein
MGVEWLFDLLADAKNVDQLETGTPFSG